MQILQAYNQSDHVLEECYMIRTRCNFIEEAQPVDICVILDIVNNISLGHPMADLSMTSVFDIGCAEKQNMVPRKYHFQNTQSRKSYKYWDALIVARSQFLAQYAENAEDGRRINYAVRHSRSELPSRSLGGLEVLEET